MRPRTGSGRAVRRTAAHVLALRPGAPTMHLTALRPHRLAAAVVALVLPLAGCSSSHHTTSSAGTPSPAASAPLSSPTSGEPSPSASASFDLSAWPTAPINVDEPGFPRGYSYGVLKRHYTGTGFIDTLTRQWHISLGARKKLDPSPKDQVPAVWHAAGTTHPSSGTELWVAGVWNLAGDLEYLTCGATVKAPGRAAFLRACARFDHPGSDPAASVRWLDSVTGPVDRKYRKDHLTVDSPLYRAGPAAAYLLEYGGGSTPATYELTFFGLKS
ncbi:hypothetical protein ACGF3G_41535 [Streptomyces sp. NPDC048179]|uniref:hypothetical protein n=1 Tax=Streptomyces sp. NPDC048179 TaxID=3365506 RepID=UPI00371911E9